MARSCVDFLSLPYQSRQGRLLDQTTAALPEGAVALFSFGARLYIIGGRSFNNSALAISVRWGDETVYLAYADGIDTRGGDINLDLLPGIYDLVKVDPFGGVVQTNVIVKEGTQLIPRSGQPFVQIVYAFPAGLLTTEELEGYIVPLNVQADWSATDPLSAAYVQNKPNFITQEDFNIILATTITEQIETEVTTQLAPTIDAAVDAAATAAADAAAAEIPAVVDAAVADAFGGTATTITANTAAVAGDRLLVDTSGGPVTVTLPVAPSDGHHIVIWRSGASAVTINRNGKTIAGLAENLVVDVDQRGVRLTYLFGGWQAFPEVLA